MHPVEAAQIAAFAAVTIDDYDSEYFYRHVFRWYSEKFHTPLHEVLDLPLDFILQHYFEVYYEGMTEVQRDEARTKLHETKEQRRQRMIREEAEAADAEEFAQQVAEEEAARAKEAAESTIDKEKKKIAQLPVDDRPRAMRADHAPPVFPSALPTPDIKMTFVDDEELEKLIEGYGDAPPPVRQKA